MKKIAILLLALSACATGQEYQTAQTPLERRCSLLMSTTMMSRPVAVAQAAYANCMAGQPVDVAPAKRTKLTCTKDAISIEPTVTCVD